MIWTIYDAARRNDPNISTVLVYAARDSGKSLAASVIRNLVRSAFKKRCYSFS